MIHLKTHPNYIEGCFTCKLSTVSFGAESLKREREGRDVTGGRGTQKYVQDMYDRARAEGRPDPVPENANAARYAPSAGVLRDKKYKEANNGL